MNKNLLIVLIVVILGVGGWFLLGTDTANGPVDDGDAMMEDDEAIMEGEEGVMMEDDEAMVGGEEGIMMEDEGVMEEVMESGDIVLSFDGASYNPSSVEISVGDTVRFENNSDSRIMWPASAVHPTHTVYPDSSIGKCGTEDAEDTFDACGTLDPGESYSFTFDWVGQWGYHDHLRPSTNGKITVN